MFTQSKDLFQHCEFLDVANSIDETATKFCELDRATLDAKDGPWFALHLTRLPVLYEKQDCLRYVRGELLRIGCEYDMRAVEPFSSAHMVAFAAMELPGPRPQTGEPLPEVLQAFKAMGDAKGCCLPIGQEDFYTWFVNTIDKCRAAAKRAFAVTTIKTEIDHGGNLRRARVPGAKPRGYRRQVANYVNSFAKTRWQAVRKGNILKSRSLSGITFKQFRAQLALHRYKGRGGNAMYHFVNQSLSRLRARGATGRLDQWRRVFAERYKNMTPAGRRYALLDFRNSRLRTTEAASYNQAEQVSGDDQEAYDPASHFGFGTSTAPIAKSDLAETLEELGSSRQGIRKAASNIFSELSLVVKPLHQKLQLPTSARACCWKKHKGFCMTDDAEKTSRWKAVLSVLKGIEKPELVGKLVLRFWSADDDPPRYIHASLGTLRGNPRYKAKYVIGMMLPMGDDADQVQFPYCVKNRYVSGGVVLGKLGLGPNNETWCIRNSWELARWLVDQFLGCITCQKLEYTVTVVPGIILVEGAELVVSDMTAPQVNEGSVKARPLRAAYALAPKKLDDEQKSSTTCGPAPSCLKDSTLAFADEDGPWWRKAMKTPCASRDGSDDSSLSDGEKLEEWIRQNADDVRSITHRRVRRRKNIAPALAPAVVETPAASSSSSSCLPPTAPAPPLFHDAGGSESWGPFTLSRVSKLGVVNTVSCTCTLHTCEGIRCNKSINFDGVRMTEFEAELRIKHWLVQGLKIPDGLGAKKEHSDENPRKYSIVDLDEAELDRIASSL